MNGVQAPLQACPCSQGRLEARQAGHAAVWTWALSAAAPQLPARLGIITLASSLSHHHISRHHACCIITSAAAALPLRLPCPCPSLQSPR